MRLKDKVALVTGAGARMGSAVAILFAQEGAKVVLTARSRETIEATAQRINEAGGQAIWLQGDMTNVADVQTVIGTTVQRFGKLNILYNNAGGFFPREVGPVEMDPEFYDRAIRNNLRLAFLCSKFAAPEMEKAGGGAIVNVAAAFKTRLDGNVAYGAAKDGLIGLTKNLARELYSRNIPSQLYLPGTDPDAASRGQDRRRATATRAERPARGCRVAAVYLCSDEASWITGQTLTVDGGDEVLVWTPWAR